MCSIFREPCTESEQQQVWQVLPLLGVPVLQLSAVIFNVFFDKALASDGKWLQHNPEKKRAKLPAFLHGRKPQPQPECKALSMSFFHCFTTNFYQSRWTWAFPAHSKLSFACTHFTRPAWLPWGWEEQMEGALNFTRIKFFLLLNFTRILFQLFFSKSSLRLLLSNRDLMLLQLD